MLHREHWVALAAAAMAVAGPTAAQSPKASDLTSAVRHAVDRGEMLYIYDRAAWEGTDDVRERYANLMSQAGGYVVSGDERQTELVFYDKAKSRAVYRATFADGKLASSGPPAADRFELTALEKRLIRAKDAALVAFEAAKVGLCANSIPNLAALPPETPGGPVIVYLMTPQVDLKVFPLGGHYSVEVGEDGSVGNVRRFTNSCIDMSLDQVPNGGKPRIFTITHLLDPTPTEIHVFTALASKIPIMVLTNPKGPLWVVEGNWVQSVPMPSK